MSYFSNPKVDKASERSEESVNLTRFLFTRKNGFIIREENPDYGVDLDVELIDKGEATRKKFAIQIKSSTGFKTKAVESQSFLILDFLTSRLGYLARNTPGLGLIILYDEQKDKLYYDYIEKIISRIVAQKKDAAWLNQEKVRINIPTINVLNYETIKSIYDKFLQALNNHNTLLQDRANDYSIPYVNISDTEFSFSEDNLIGLINKYGLYLFNNLMFSELFESISRISYQKISQNPKLSFLAAIAYSEIGKPIDSNMFIQYFEINKTEENSTLQDILKFTKYRNNFLLGYRNLEVLIRDFEVLVSKSDIEQNTLTYKINIALFKTIANFDKKEPEMSLLNEFKGLHEEIDNSDIPENLKHLFSIFQAENYHSYALSIFSELITQQRLKEKLRVEIKKDERIANAKTLNDILSLPVLYVHKALDFANSSSDKLVEAHAYHKIALFSFKNQFNYLLHKIDLDKTASVKILKTGYNYAIHGYKLFLEQMLLNDAHLALCLAYDINKLLQLKFNEESIIEDQESLLVTIKEIETRIGKKRFISIVEKYFNDKSIHEKAKLANFSEKEIEFFANAILKAKGLPLSRLQNIILDIKNRQYFEINCDTDKYELIQNNIEGSDMYKYPTNYVMINKKNNIFLGKSTNLIKLISDLGINNNKNEA